MFYEPKKKNHGLAKNPFNSLIVPRPIGWISSADAAGVYNLAPYSFFNAVSYQPPTVMFSAGAGANDDRLKDSARNIEETGEFVCNLATWETREQMNHSSIAAGPEVDEIAARGEAAGCLGMPPTLMPPPIGYICMLTDPDGNTVEFSWDQGVYATVQERWGDRTD